MQHGRTQYYTAASLDGYITGEDHGMDWLFQFEDDGESTFPAFIRDVGALAMGSATYEWLLRNHIYADPDAPQPWPYEQPAWVFSRRSLPAVVGADVRFAKGPVEPVHAAMRAAAGSRNLWIVGGGDLAGQFYEAGLLDEIILTLAPVLLAGGAPVFTRRMDTPPLEVREVVPQSNGLTTVRLEVPAVS